MPYVLELPPDADLKLRQRASRRHMSPEDYLQAKMLGWLRPRPEPNVRLTPEEQETLNALNAELPRDFWLHWNALNEKLDAARRGEAIYTDEDREEGIRCAEISEEWNVRRITAIAAMAKRRGMTWSELMKQFQITHHPDSMAGR